MEAKKHSYGGRMCMACGGMACNVSYEELRKQVESKRSVPMGEKRQELSTSKPGIAKGMMTPLGRFAKGGTVSQAEDDLEVKGIHGGVPVRSTAGTDKSHAVSWAGHGVREANKHGKSTSKVAKEEHNRVLSEMKSMKKPHGNYAEGGQVFDYDEYGNIKGKKQDKSNTDMALDSIRDALSGNEAHADENKAHGGMMEEKEKPAGDDDEMIMDQCAGECMDAIEKKDKAAFKDALHVLVSDLLRKLG